MVGGVRPSRGDNSGSTSLMESCIEYECVCVCVRPFVSPRRASCYDDPEELTGCVNVGFCHTWPETGHHTDGVFFRKSLIM